MQEHVEVEIVSGKGAQQTSNTPAMYITIIITTSNLCVSEANPSESLPSRYPRAYG